MRTMTISDWVVRLAGVTALVLGLLMWIANLSLNTVHILVGLIVTFALLAMSALAVSTNELRVLGIIGLVYSGILPLLGLTQENLLTSNLHWVIQVLHLLVGIGAMALAGIIGARYQRLQKAQTS